MLGLRSLPHRWRNRNPDGEIRQATLRRRNATSLRCRPHASLYRARAGQAIPDYRHENYRLKIRYTFASRVP